MAPAAAAFAERFPEAQLWHLMDDRLIVEADAAGGVDDRLRDRMLHLVEHAVRGGAAGVLLTCSQYSPVASDALERFGLPVAGSDEAMFRQIANEGPRTIALLASLESTATESRTRLSATLRAFGVPTEVIGVFCPDAYTASASPDRGDLVEALARGAAPYRESADLFAVAQYSLSPAVDALQTALGARVLSPTHVAADDLQKQLGMV